MAGNGSNPPAREKGRFDPNRIETASNFTAWPESGDMHSPSRGRHALFVYSIEIAPVGHSSTHAPQSMHSSASTTATSPSIVIASEGHTSTQEPHPEQESASTIAAMFYPRVD
jgi:hypothetical protein